MYEDEREKSFHFRHLGEYFDLPYLVPLYSHVIIPGFIMVSMNMLGTVLT